MCLGSTVLNYLVTARYLRILQNSACRMHWIVFQDRSADLSCPCWHSMCLGSTALDYLVIGNCVRMIQNSACVMHWIVFQARSTDSLCPCWHLMCCGSPDLDYNEHFVLVTDSCLCDVAVLKWSYIFSDRAVHSSLPGDGSFTHWSIPQRDMWWIWVLMILITLPNSYLHFIHWLWLNTGKLRFKCKLKWKRVNS